MDKEITLVSQTKLDNSLSHISAIHEEVRFKGIQSKVLDEVKKATDIVLRRKSDLWTKNNGKSSTNSKTH